MIKDINDLEEPVSTDNSVDTSSTDDFGPIQMGLGGTTPISSTTPITQDQTTSPATTPTVTSETKTPEPDQAALNAAFQKYMGSSFNPNSTMDKGKMETVKKALADFQKQNNKPFDINDSEDLSKMRPIINAAYQSEEYKQAEGSRSSNASKPSTSVGGKTQTPAQKKATSPASPKSGPTYYVRTGFNQYRPAVQADIASNQQLFMKNPNRAAAMVYPYVKVDSRPIRRASPVK